MTNPYGQQSFGQQPYGQQPQQPGYGPPSGGMPAPGYGPPSGAVPTPFGQPAPYGQQAPFGQPTPYGMASPYGQPGFGGPGGDPNQIPDYKGWAIGCIFLFWILAIFAIMKSNEVNTYKMQGNYAAAMEASRATKTLCLIATIVGGAGCVLGLVYLIVGLAALS